MNLLETEVKRVDGGFRLLAAPDMGFDISGDGLDQVAQKALAMTARVRVGVRPQRIGISEGAVPVRIVSNQWLGDQSHVAGECAGQLLIAVIPGRIAARPGDMIKFAIAPRHLNIFGSDGVCIRHAEVS